MTNRRKYSNTNSAAKIIKTIAAPKSCMPCMDLKHTPAFVEAIMATNKIMATQVQDWWHMRGHSLFKK